MQALAVHVGSDNLVLGPVVSLELPLHDDAEVVGLQPNEELVPGHIHVSIHDEPSCSVRDLKVDCS